MNDLRVSLIQASTLWHDAPANRAMYGSLARSVRNQTDLVVLPETFLSGFSNDAASKPESTDGESMSWLRDLAAECGAVITGSLVMQQGDKAVNRLIWMRPDGSYDVYDKRHLFRMANEHQRYYAGSDRLIVELNGWRICPLVCYDLRFPVFARNRFAERMAQNRDYDLLVFVANWPSARAYAWKTLLRARAIENLSYCVGVNRVGVDGNDLHYGGDSVALDFIGQPLIELATQMQVATVSLSWEALQAHRTRFPAFLDQDEFELKPFNRDPGRHE
jgi:omega-amidase